MKKKKLKKIMRSAHQTLTSVLDREPSKCPDPENYIDKDAKEVVAKLQTEMKRAGRSQMSLGEINVALRSVLPTVQRQNPVDLAFEVAGTLKEVWNRLTLGFVGGVKVGTPLLNVADDLGHQARDAIDVLRTALDRRKVSWDPNLRGIAQAAAEYIDSVSSTDAGSAVGALGKLLVDLGVAVPQNISFEDAFTLLDRHLRNEKWEADMAIRSARNELEKTIKETIGPLVPHLEHDDAINILRRVRPILAGLHPMPADTQALATDLGEARIALGEVMPETKNFHLPEMAQAAATRILHLREQLSEAGSFAAIAIARNTLRKLAPPEVSSEMVSLAQWAAHEIAKLRVAVGPPLSKETEVEVFVDPPEPIATSDAVLETMEHTLAAAAELGAIKTRQVIFVVNGEDAVLLLPEEMTLDEAKEIALKKTNNTGRPASDWETRFVSGHRASGGIRLKDIPKDQLRLFASLQVGAGGTNGAAGPARPTAHATQPDVTPGGQAGWVPRKDGSSGQSPAGG